MRHFLVLAAAVVTASSAPSPTPTATQRVTVAPTAGAHSETYGNKVPPQLRPQGSAVVGSEAPPTPAPSSLAGMAARIKLNRTGGAPLRVTDHAIGNVPRPGRTPATGAERGPEPYRVDVAAYRKGDGIEVYFVVESRAGDEVAVNGTYRLTIEASGTRNREIRCPWGAPGCAEPEKFTEYVYSRDEALASADFQNATVGRGAFAHSRLIRSVGRIPFSEMTIGAASDLSLEVRVVVYTAGWPAVGGAEKVYLR